MAHDKEIALLCRINAGGFSGERVVEVPLPGGAEQKVLAPRHYCWTRAGQPLDPEVPMLGQPIDGLVAARRLRDLPNDKGVVVNTPDGEVFVVSSGIIRSRPAVSEASSNVPV